MAIIAKSPEELQAQLDTVVTYYEKWSIKVNVDKTKINVLRKRGGLLPRKGQLCRNNIEVVNNTNKYLLLFLLNQYFFKVLKQYFFIE